MAGAGNEEGLGFLHQSQGAEHFLLLSRGCAELLRGEQVDVARKRFDPLAVAEQVAAEDPDDLVVVVDPLELDELIPMVLEIFAQIDVQTI